MKTQPTLNEKGIGIIELLVVLVVSGFLVGGIYRLFIGQSRAYAVQDQVVEVQQNVRAGFEILLRDLRMTGFDDDRTPAVRITDPVTPGDHSITVRYEYNNSLREVTYWVDERSRLMRQETQNGSSTTEPLLENTEAFNLTYGVDDDAFGNEDGAVDSWKSSVADLGGKKVLAVSVSLTARPDQVNPNVKNVSPRTLVSKVVFRNRSFK